MRLIIWKNIWNIWNNYCNCNGNLLFSMHIKAEVQSEKRVIFIVIFIVMLLLILGKIIDYKRKKQLQLMMENGRSRISSRRISEHPVTFSHITIWVELLFSVEIQWKQVLVNGLVS